MLFFLMLHMHSISISHST